MSIHKSLFTAGKLGGHRNVLTRAERLEILKREGRWKEEQSVFGLPKVRSIMMRAKKKAKEKEQAVAAEAAAGAGAVPAADAKAAAPAAPAGAKGAAPAAAAGAKAAAPAAGPKGAASKKEEKKK